MSPSRHEPDPPDPRGRSASRVLRRQVDAAVHPGFEHAFAILDAVDGHRQRHPGAADPARLAQLEGALARQLARIEEMSGEHLHYGPDR